MKSARAHAYDMAALVGLTPSHRHYLSIVDAAEVSFKEHARDQRQIIAELVRNKGFLDTMDETHARIMNAPAPGEQP